MTPWLCYGIIERLLASTADWIRQPAWAYFPPSPFFVVALLVGYAVVGSFIGLAAAAMPFPYREDHLWRAASVSRCALLILFVVSLAYEFFGPFARHNRTLNGLALATQA